MSFSDTIHRLKSALPAASWTEDPEVIAPHLLEQRGLWHGRASFMVMPGCSLEAQTVMQICHNTGTPIVPQGGNTGLTGGGMPGLERDEIPVSMKRMNHILDIDPSGFSLTAEAGVILAHIQQAAADQNRLFPLSLASEGSCTVGGIISTNAGGVHVLRYGTTRSLVLGLEAVMPNGALWHGLSPLVKDNTGYDLKNLIIGAEGTLGLVTKATLRLFRRPTSTLAGWFGADSIDDVMRCFTAARGQLGDHLNAFEIMVDRGLEFVCQHFPAARRPMSTPCRWHMLVECIGDDDTYLNHKMETLFADLYEKGLLLDGTIARSGKDAADLWFLRESLSQAQKSQGVSIKHDISLPIAAIAPFIHQTLPRLEKLCPGIRPVPFGHAGDGNLHFNLTQPVDMEPESYKAKAPLLSACVYEMVAAYGGSFSAEHGIGIAKKQQLTTFKDPAALAAMKAIKQALDPENICNPGRIFDLN